MSNQVNKTDKDQKPPDQVNSKVRLEIVDKYENSERVEYRSMGQQNPSAKILSNQSS